MVDAERVLRSLREAQDSIICVIFDMDDEFDEKRLGKALTLIGDTMDDISRQYDLPIMSEQ